MRIFADCADFTVMQSLADDVSGFTTNPTLMRAAGVNDYGSFARTCVDEFPGHSLSFEVIADDLVTMMHQAHHIAGWGPNVFVKIPVTTTSGQPTTDLVTSLSRDGVQVNVTAMFTPPQADAFSDALDGGGKAYLSIFAGRIADAGRDPSEFIRQAARYAPDNVSVLWASAREALNVQQAYQSGADIITLTPDLLAKYKKCNGKDLLVFSRQTVQMFYDDAQAAGLTLDY